MSQNESYDLAEAWVLEQINDELHDEVITDGTTIDATDLHQCDCVPVDLKDSQGRLWQLVAVKWGGTFFPSSGNLAATYRCVGAEKGYTRADYEADRADMAHSDGERN